MKRRHIVFTILAFVTGIAFVAIGAYRNEVAIVLKKAVMICLECIGIG
ncbi:MAG: hypothetical protein GX802_01310 [Clostridiales bacterium]|nr:hypothetical protein [Clostridiales bacterium]